MNTTLSVVMCTYNGARWVAEQIDSILAQDLQPDELIIQDDLSTDDTWAVLQDYAARCPQIHIYRNDERLGINDNFFSVLSRAHGEYISISDQDDIWQPHKLSRQMSAIGNRLLCAHRSQHFTTDHLSIDNDTRMPNHVLTRLCFSSAFGGHTMVMHRRLLSLLPREGGRVASPFCYDVVLATTAAAYESIVFLNEPLVMQRRTTSAATFTPPLNHSRTPLNIARYFARTLRVYFEVRPVIAERMAAHHHFLSLIPAQTRQLSDALRITELMSHQEKGLRGLAYFLKQQRYCFKHATQLFYTPLPDTLLTRLRGAYFPISCSDYLRYFSPWWNRHHGWRRQPERKTPCQDPTPTPPPPTE